MRSSLRDTYNQIARYWALDHQSDTWWIEGTDTFLSFLAPGERILDVGCGTGWKSRYMLDRGFRVTGFDLSDGMVELAREQAPEADFYILDLIDVRQIPGQFDAVFAQAVLLHISKSMVSQAIVGLAAKLRCGGYFYAAVKSQRSGQAEEEVKTEDDYGFSYQRFFSYYTQPELEKLFRWAGLTVVWSGIARYNKVTWIQIIAQKQT